jgi:Cdc6-like AAA superfamily ATPase
MTDFHFYAFSEDFIPKEIIDREKEQEIIANFLKETANGKNSTLYIYGIPGIGKTVVTRSIANQFEETRENASMIYLTCSALTPTNALKEVYFQICGRVGPSLEY